MTVHDLRHDAFIHDTDELLVDQVASFLRAGFAEGEASIAILRPRSWELVREELGPECEARMSFIANPQEWYTRPTVAIGGYDATLADLAAGSPSVRVVAEIPQCSKQEEWDDWMSYEAVANRAFAPYPAWILCAYDARVMPDRVVEGAWHTHERVLTDEWQVNGRYEEPEQVLRAFARARTDAPVLELRTMPLPDGPRALRAQLAREMAAAQVPEDRAHDMLVAANEVAVNAWRHGGGPTKLRAGRVGDDFVCELGDGGTRFENLLAGYLPPRREESGGGGLWVARQLTARLDVLPGPEGLTIRLWI